MGILDVNTATMTLFSFRTVQREVHLCRARRLVYYVVTFKHDTIRIRTKEHGLHSTPITTYEWEESVYGKVTELMPQKSPAPKVKHVVTVSYYDDNLHHKVVA